MTEADWLSSQNPSALLPKHFEVTDRAFRLVAVACCRFYWNALTDWRCRRAVEVAERHADGMATDEELASARKGIILGRRLSTAALAYRATEAIAYHAAGETIGVAKALVSKSRHLNPRDAVLWYIRDDIPLPAIAAIVRDSLGNPFRPVSFDPAWYTSTVLAVAEGIYADCAFDRLPILADALQDAGCEDADLLGHLRGDGPHVRGCWALDLVLGKE